MDNYIKLGKKYKCLKKLIFIAVPIVFIIIALIPIHIWLKILLGIVIVIASLGLALRVDALTGKFLYNECNPEKYYCVHKADPKSIVTCEELMSIAALGDFNKAAGLSKEELAYPKSKSKFYIENFQLLYAECLFSAGFIISIRLMI